MIAVITTIQPPTEPVKRLSKLTDVIVVGDAKTPSYYNVGTFIPLEKQDAFNISKLTPINAYSRKNIGYLHAIADGHGVIYETDDDNYPAENWMQRGEVVDAIPLFGNKWVNPYRWFASMDDIWPRGIPLQYTKDGIKSSTTSISVVAPLQQCLVNVSPDVDAVYRLLNKGSFRFRTRESVVVSDWAPTNSQNTWWFKRAFPLMYLPSYCSFRASDIWRGMFAQRCLREMGFGIVYHSADAIQHRNKHDLLKDFEQEVPLHLFNDKMASILDDTSLTGRPIDDIHICYRSVVNSGILPEKELYVLDAWLKNFV